MAGTKSKRERVRIATDSRGNYQRDLGWKAVADGRFKLVSRLVRVITPRPGMHVYYRCAKYGVSQKLAFAPSTDAGGRPVRTTLIETKGEGGYCLIPPSPPRCHPTCRLYGYADGSPTLADVPTITPEERFLLLKAARSLNQWQEPKPAKRTSTAAPR